MSQTIDGINEKVIKEFMAEADEIVDAINSDLMEISSVEDIEEIDPDLLNSVFRGAHTLKGLSGMFGFQDISFLSHNLEDILDTIRLGKLQLTPEVLDILFEGMDFLTSLIKDVENAEPGTYVAREQEVKEFIANIKKKLSGDDEEGAAPEEEGEGERILYLDKRILSVLTEYEEHRLEENKRKDRNLFLLHAVFRLEIFDDELTRLTNEFKPLGEVISILPSSGEAAEGTIAFDILTGSTNTKKEVQAAVSRKIEIIDLYSKEDTEGVILPEDASEEEKGAPFAEELPGAVLAEEKPVKEEKRGRRGEYEAPRKEVIKEAVEASAEEFTGELPDAVLAEEKPVKEEKQDRRGEYEAPRKEVIKEEEVAEVDEELEPSKKSKAPLIKDSIKSITQTVRVDVTRLDSLMNVVGELVLSKSIISGITDRLKEQEGFTGIAVDLYKANRILARKLDELQSKVMDIRLIPLSQVFEKMTRI
ncbi:Hpt domain-containing protein, partial [Thermodesulfobacteriota bacterium]